MTTPLSEKYRPKKFSEIVGQELAIDKLKAFVSAFQKGITKKKAILFYGSPGTGKTTLAHVLASELVYEILELNASDLRNRAKLDEVMKPSSLQHSLFAKGKIILVDEVDGVTSTEYGGLSELVALIEKTKFPVIITCNDIWQNKFSLLRNKCEMVQVKELSYLEILNYIQQIAIKENKIIPETILKEISAKSRGDLRAALNDLQSVIDTECTEDGVCIREKAQDIFNAIKEVLKYRTTPQTINAFDNVEMESDQLMLWLEENIPTEYRGEELAKAFEALSKADVFKGRIHRQQYWHFMVYENFFLTAGVSAAKGNKAMPQKFTKYSTPKRVLKIWMANQREAKKKSIAGKFAELLHTSKERAIRDFSILAIISTDETIKDLDLSDQEQEYFQETRQKLLTSLGKLG